MSAWLLAISLLLLLMCFAGGFWFTRKYLVDAAAGSVQSGPRARTRGSGAEGPGLGLGFRQQA